MATIIEKSTDSEKYISDAKELKELIEAKMYDQRNQHATYRMFICTNLNHFY